MVGCFVVKCVVRLAREVTGSNFLVCFTVVSVTMSVTKSVWLISVCGNVSESIVGVTIEEVESDEVVSTVGDLVIVVGANVVVFEDETDDVVEEDGVGGMAVDEDKSEERTGVDDVVECD